MKGTILIYSQSHLERDPRVHRQIKALSDDYDIIAFGKSPPSISVTGFYDIAKPIGVPSEPVKRLKDVVGYIREHGLGRFIVIGIFYGLWRNPVFPKIRSFFETYWVRAKVLKEIRNTHCEIIIANDITGLAVCGAGKGARKLIYDAHEYSPGQHVDVGLGRSKNRYADAVLKTWLGKCDSMMTIGYGIADLYQSNYGIRPVVITNSPYYKTLSPKRTEDGRIRLVHHGLAARQRNLETMIEVLRLLDERFTLDFYLVSHDDTYYKELRNFAAQEKRVRFNEPVPMTELPECLNQYDIGIRFYPANTLNLQNGLPNKFFEFVQARLGVAVGPTPEAKRMVEKYGFGVVAKDFEPASMARALNALTSEDVMRFKSRADSCAYELSADENAKRLKAMIDGLQGTGDVA